jgi:hypothetical protein
MNGRCGSFKDTACHHIYFVTNWLTQVIGFGSDGRDCADFTLIVFCKTHVHRCLVDDIDHKQYLFPSLANGIITSVSASFSTSNFVGSANSYGNQMQEQNLESSSATAQCPTQTLPSRPKTQRPRVPPPSKVSTKHIT